LERIENPAEGGERGLLSFSLGADGRGSGLLVCPMSGSRQPVTAEGLARGEQYMRMDGRAVFKWAIRLAEENLRAVIKAAGLTLDDIDCFVLHQANLRIIDATRAALGVSADRFAVNIDRYGNTSAASVPIALREAYEAGRLQKGKLVVMPAFGAGMAWGHLLLRW
jgi:3-oxoacyl-[acyl-carrier-protein] synthase-3